LGATKYWGSEETQDEPNARENRTGKIIVGEKKLMKAEVGETPVD